MGRLDTSRAGQLRVLAEKLRRRARDMTMDSYIEMMQRAARDLDDEASELEAEAIRQRFEPGRRLDIRI